MKLILALMLMFACSAPADPAPEWAPSEPVMVSYELTPEASLFGFSQRAVYRWNKARGCTEGSGCELVLGEDGIPVQYVDEILMPDLDDKGEPMRASGSSQPVAPGYPGCDWLYVHVSLETDNPERTIVHELAHVLGLVRHTHTGVTHDQPDLDHAGMIAIQAWSINADVLSAVCSKTVCLEFNPEP
jgi:hypothetical protein